MTKRSLHGVGCRPMCDAPTGGRDGLDLAPPNHALGRRMSERVRRHGAALGAPCRQRLARGAGACAGACAGSRRSARAERPPAPAPAPAGCRCRASSASSPTGSTCARARAPSIPTAWVFRRAGLPVEIIQEFESWRQVRDAEGTTGWVLGTVLSGRRTALDPALGGEGRTGSAGDRGAARRRQRERRAPSPRWRPACSPASSTATAAGAASRSAAIAATSSRPSSGATYQGEVIK